MRFQQFLTLQIANCIVILSLQKVSVHRLKLKISQLSQLNIQIQTVVMFVEKVIHIDINSLFISMLRVLNNLIRIHKLSFRRSHDEKKQFLCQVCGQAFVSHIELSNHGKSHISGDSNMFICSVCFNVFANESSLERHSKRHDTQKPHACMICYKTFVRKEHLDNHLRSHDGKAPFVCQYCSSCFTRKEHLMNHVKRHTGETEFRCEICQKIFTRLLNKIELIYS